MLTAPRLTSVAAMMSMALTSAASADLVVATWLNGTNFHCKRSHMPDLDQRRDDCCGSMGLPSDGGMYCAPTGTMNLFCYAANHGFWWLDPGQANWNAPATYDLANAAIFELGQYMGTHPTNGTGGSGLKDGTQEWLNRYGLGTLTRTAVYMDGIYSSMVPAMTAVNINGGVVAFAYGRYDVVGNVGGVPILDRAGGHVVTYTEAKRTGSTYTLRYRDPADAPNDAVQSTFVSKEVTVTPIIVIMDDIDGLPRIVDAIDYPSSDGRLRIIDKYVAIKPIWFLSFKNTGNGYLLQQVAPFSLSPPAPSISMGPIFGVSDLQIELHGETALGIVQTGAITAVPKLRRFNLVDGSYSDLPIPGLKRFVTGPDGRIYAHDGSKVYCLLPDGTTESATSSIPIPTAMAFDDVNNHVVLLSVPNRAVTRLTASLAHVSTYVIPTSMPMAGDGSVVVDPVTGRAIFITAATPDLGEVTGLSAPFSFGRHTVAGLPTPKALSPSDDGKLFVSTVNGLRVLARGAGGGGPSWVIETDSLFHNLDITGVMSAHRSRTNVNPAIHDAPGWNNILPANLLAIGTPIPDCTGDVDGDNDVDGADLGRLLANWGTVGGNSDLNGDGTVNGADLGDLLAQWGPCL